MATRHKVGPKVLADLMGHEDIKTTLDYYVESSDDALAEAMAMVDLPLGD